MSPDAAHAPVRVKFDVEAARREFPILEERIHGRPLVYLDNANTTQKPKQVLETLDEFYRHQNKLTAIDGVGSMEDVFERIVEALDSRYA